MSMRRYVVCGMVFLIMAFAEVSAILPNASATLITFFDRLNFEAAAPGLITQDFEAGKLPAGKNFTLFGSPLDSATDNGVFDPEDIQPGISFTTVKNVFDKLPPNSFFSLSTDIPPGADGKLLNSLKDGAPLTITTDLGVLALGVDVFSLSLGPEGGPPNLSIQGILFNVTVAAPDGTYEVYGSVDPNPPFNQPSFIGFITDAGTITSLTLTPTTSFGVVGIDNVAYAPVPEPSTILLLGSGLAGLGFFRRRRKDRKNPSIAQHQPTQ